ncbi:helix-turn-helix domain-containing protein [Aliivibrio logei]|uniref:Transcriptional regulator n=1 Tax=Aliivibrio logei 5S-186 TaxID=626086 RepID=A0ABX3B2F6_ALILO|nr:helix-turn-helix transcriptional regulator [Aliivibrio logei]OEF22517.1 transcriptional regulator [Aliivibrio logei 5S-186]
MFGEVVRLFRKNNELSQTKFVDIIQRSNENFYNLDVVTLSRWERGITKPHLSRQNELLDLIGVNIFDVWEDEDIKKSLSTVLNRINCDSYITENLKPDLTVTRINANNSFMLNDFISELELISSYERNFLFESCSDKGLEVKGVFEKIINQYAGELTIVFINGHLVGHILTVNYSLLGDLVPILSKVSDDDSHLVTSVNINHMHAIIPTIGKEVYKYLQSSNPTTKLHVLVNNKRMFDILFNLGFEYKTIVNDSDVAKMMNISNKKLKSQRVWMNILSNFKGDNNV